MNFRPPQKLPLGTSAGGQEKKLSPSPGIFQILFAFFLKTTLVSNPNFAAAAAAIAAKGVFGAPPAKIHQIPSPTSPIQPEEPAANQKSAKLSATDSAQKLLSKMTSLLSSQPTDDIPPPPPPPPLTKESTSYS